jgi:hypothetical protein
MRETARQRSLLLRLPVVTERDQPRERFQVLPSPRRLLAGDDVVEMADREPGDLDPPLPGILERLDAVRRENQIKVERTILELHEVFTAQNLRRLLVGKPETKFPQRGHDGRAVVRRAIHKHDGILHRIGKPQQDRTGLPDEQILGPLPRKGVSNLLGLTILKRGHNRAIPAGSLRTSGDSLPLGRTTGTTRRQGPACTS